jgi:hypothetical protein
LIGIWRGLRLAGAWNGRRYGIAGPVGGRIARLRRRRWNRIRRDLHHPDQHLARSALRCACGACGRVAAVRSSDCMVSFSIDEDVRSLAGRFSNRPQYSRLTKITLRIGFSIAC